MKKYDIVISRYNEDISWVNQLDTEKYNILLYNKGEDNIDYPHINRPNIGREAETMVNYILENYDKLPEFIVTATLSVIRTFMSVPSRDLIISIGPSTLSMVPRMRTGGCC